jgi:hypothetical protein
MYKKLYIFIFLLLQVQILPAKEPSMAFLVSIKSNGIQIYRKENYTFECSAYGVLSIDELYNDSLLNDVCKKNILKFYKKRPDLKKYIYSKLNVMQMYNVQIKKDGCIVNISGGKSLSEFLLDEGLAVVKPFTKDEEYDYYFKQSQLEAKIQKKGIWKENITKECVANIYKR